MITIKRITIKNFLSIGNNPQSVNFDRMGSLTLVLGNNHDVVGINAASRNGVGKTTLVQSLSYGLYGKPLTRVKLPNLINNINKKQLSVTVEFSNGKNEYRIERGQKPNFLRFFVNNEKVNEDDGEEKNEALGENKNTQADINSVVGLSHGLFRHIVALSTFVTPFLMQSVGDQRTIIEELFGIALISQKAEALRKLNGTTKEELRVLEASLRATNDANQRIEAAIRQARHNSVQWSRAQNKKIANLNEEIESIAHIDFDQELLLYDTYEANQHLRTDLNYKIRTLETELSLVDQKITNLKREKFEVDPFYAKEINRLTLYRERRGKEQKEVGDGILSSREQIKTFEKSLQDSDIMICDCCDQPLKGTDHLDLVISNLGKKIQNSKETLSNEEKKHREILEEISHLDADIERLVLEKGNQQNLISQNQILNKSQISELTNNRINFEKQIQTLSDETASLESQRSSFESKDEIYTVKQAFENLKKDLEVEEQRINPYVDQIDTLVSTLQIVDFQPFNELQVLQKHQEFLLKLLTSKDSFIRKKIIDQNLNYLNNRLNYYTGKLGLPHEVVFKSDLSVEISILGRDMDFEQLSRGEMNRVILATSWSFRDVWEGLNQSIILLWIDEMLDQGTDSSGVDQAIMILKSMANDRKKDIFLISHRDELSATIDRVLTVNKVSDFTSFEES